MARDEDAIIEAKKYYRNDIKCYDAFLHGVEWAENQIANVWHDASEMPKVGERICVHFGEDDCSAYKLGGINEAKWYFWCKIYNVIRWAYISDLLPKQFGNSEQLKGGEK